MRTNLQFFQNVLIVCVFLCNIFFVNITNAQAVIANFDYNGATTYPVAANTTASGISCSLTCTEAFTTFSGTVSGAQAFVSNSTAGNAVAMNNSSGTNTRYWILNVSGTNLSNYLSYKLYMQAQRSGTGATVITVAYSTDGVNFTNCGVTMSPGNGSFGEQIFDLSGFTELNYQSNLYLKIMASGASSTGTLRIDNLQVQANVGYPTITQQPITINNVCINSNAVFSVATSANNPTYQWQMSVDGISGWSNVVNNIPTGVNYSNATTSEFTINSTTAISSYYYRCVVSLSGGGSTNSNCASLTIIAAPTITSNPENTTMFIGGSSDLHVSATGAGLTYQWQYENSGTWSNVSNGSPIGSTYVNSTTNTLTVMGILESGNFQYRCVSTGTCNPYVTSAAATLTVYLNSSGVWSATGNANINDTVNFIGTTNNHDLVLKSNNIEQMRLSKTGNIGVGTSNPEANFDINGSLRIRSNAANNYVLTSDSIGNSTWKQIPITPITLLGAGATSISGAYPDFTISSVDNNTKYTGGNGINVIGNTINLDSAAIPNLWTIDGGTIYNNPGKIGVGTFLPEAKLHIKTINDFDDNGQNRLTEDIPALRLEHTNSIFGTSIWDFKSTMYDVNISQLDIGTLGTQLFSIRSTGNVGIGTTQPLAKLHVNGGIKLGAAGTNAAAGTLEFKNNEFWGVTSSGSKVLGKWSNSTTSGGSIYYNGGNVGIGTTEPSEKLDVQGNIKLNFNMLMLKDGHHGLKYADTYNSEEIDGPVLHGFSGGALGTCTGTEANPVEKIALHWDFRGNVGIGTKPTEHAKLTVKGNIHAEDVYVKANVEAPDYVFAEDYNLVNLVDVEKYIQENCHLPEIPSAHEIEKDGIDLSKMNLLMLKKVEELTLYIIEQSKQIKDLQKEVQHLKIK